MRNRIYKDRLFVFLFGKEENKAWTLDLYSACKEYTLEQAVDKAVDEMPDDFRIKQVLIANRAEVKDMWLTEYNEEEVMQQFKEEGREEGREERDKEIIQAMLLKGRLPQEISDFCDYPIALIEEVQESMTVGIE